MPRRTRLPGLSEAQQAEVNYLFRLPQSITLTSALQTRLELYLRDLRKCSAAELPKLQGKIEAIEELLATYKSIQEEQGNGRGRTESAGPDQQSAERANAARRSAATEYPGPFFSRI